MTTEKSAPKKSSPFMWIAIGIVALIFVGARQIHPRGVRGLLGDLIVSAQSSPEIEAIHDKMLTALKPIGAAALCLKHSDDPGIHKAVEKYNRRNSAELKKLVNTIKAEGGMSQSEKDLLDRQAMQEARKFIDKGSKRDTVCDNLEFRLNSGEFDLE
ncbi:hypothetical protein [Desulfohalobium retbaense]|uniref:hypothetical protein n=1 Tax=Desulfohalobium retbaense TaxID=45663 RepID=UPI00019B4A86|nr:hypothetical protein [Desulfohalobium retbaense]